MLPSFINKTFFNEKFIFLKFFYKKVLKFKLFIEKKDFFFKQKDYYDLNFRFNSIKDFFLIKKFKDFQKKFKSYKFKKIIKNNNSFLVSSY